MQEAEKISIHVRDLSISDGYIAKEFISFLKPACEAEELKCFLAGGGSLRYALEIRLFVFERVAITIQTKHQNNHGLRHVMPCSMDQGS
jgi:hypothetical protein